MTDDVWTRNEPDSPCIRVCTIHPDSGLCLGCGRSAAEIDRWACMTPEKRHEILAALPGRNPGPARRGGAAGRRVGRRVGRRAGGGTGNAKS